ncbi:hypothetical protein [Curtobacterium sp. MCBD17_028]|uniref:hypothetical protein n=1 Tax=Curtobacterium sp. MCBD17_028 TaxID=2175670 RepID=UPI000DAAAE0B|nr:hypothetical protein [Curtobacterium sp. MCBD17_028]PZE23857.1 hypothetical protein DEI86_13510 [Curtobacterium sp. MCBD17_028]
MILNGLFPDVEQLVIGFVHRILDPLVDGGIDVVSELPMDWDATVTPDKVPLVMVERTPGPGSTNTQYETALSVDITVFHTDRGSLWDLVRPLEAALPSIPDTGEVDELAVPSTFGSLAYKNPKVRRAVATIELVARAH